MNHNADEIKAMPAPSVKKLLRARGYTFSDVARRLDCVPSHVSRTVRKQSSSDRVWAEIAAMLNESRRKAS